MNDRKIKYVDLNGLQYFAKELKRYLESHVIEYSIYEELLERIQDKLDKLVNITYSELKSLRDNSQLIPGQQYRITDYITTTVQENTQSAGHQFDIIVVADDVNVLNENAKAIQHEGDTYFSNSDLNAWQIWYCLDNDTSRFAWAVPASDGGKGVIYRMIDEFNNDCPYDFKNILYNNQYTFGQVSDDSLKTSCNNTIKPYKSLNVQQINRIVCDKNCSGNYFDFDNYEHTLGQGCRNNSFEKHCYRMSLGNSCLRNSFGIFSRANKLGAECNSNVFMSSSYWNTLAIGCRGNYIGQFCNNIILPLFSSNNTFDVGVSVSVRNNETAAFNFLVKNYHFTSGLFGEVQVERGRTYKTTVAVDSSGNVKQFCIANIADTI